MQVIGNRFGSGKLLIVGSTQPTFRSNRCESSGLYITTNGTAKSGIVSDNHFDYFTGSEPSGGPGGPWNWSLDVALAQGDWQIENNQASGIIRVLPVLDAGKVNELVYNAQVKGNRAVVLQVGYLAPAQINPTPVPQTNPNTATPAADSIIMVIGNNMGDIPANSPNYGFVVNIYSKAVVNLNVSTKGSANTSNMAKGINSPNLLL